MKKTLCTGLVLSWVISGAAWAADEPVAEPALEPAVKSEPAAIAEPDLAPTAKSKPASVPAAKSGHDIYGYTHLHHGHSQGMWMFEYRYMRMNMDGLLDGTKKVRAQDISETDMTGSSPTVGKKYMMAPTDMTMDMHMFMGMYDVTSRFTVMGMLNYLKSEMDMVMYMDMNMDGTSEPMSGMLPMKSSGLGDTILSAAYQVRDPLSVGLGISIPTGSIDQKGRMMASDPETQLPYTMQLGSGTYDLIPTLTYNANAGSFNWGGQGTIIYRIGENDNGYRFGHRAEMSGWLKYAFASHAVATSRLTYTMWGNVDGQDLAVDPMMSPDSDPNAQGGIRTDLFLGMSAFKNGWIFSGEFGVPLYQDLNGPQLKTISIFQLGVSYMVM